MNLGVQCTMWNNFRKNCMRKCDSDHCHCFVDNRNLLKIGPSRRLQHPLLQFNGETRKRNVCILDHQNGYGTYKFCFLLPIGPVGLVYLPTWMVDFYGKLVWKYIILDIMAMGMHAWLEWIRFNTCFAGKEPQHFETLYIASFLLAGWNDGCNLTDRGRVFSMSSRWHPHANLHRMLEGNHIHTHKPVGWGYQTFERTVYLQVDKVTVN